MSCYIRESFRFAVKNFDKKYINLKTENVFACNRLFGSRVSVSFLCMCVCVIFSAKSTYLLTHVHTSAARPVV